MFCPDNFVSQITLKKTAGQDERLLNNVADHILWFAKNKEEIKFRESLVRRGTDLQELGQYSRIQEDSGLRRAARREDFDFSGKLTISGRPFRLVIGTSSGHGGNTSFPVSFQGAEYLPTANRHWSSHAPGMSRLIAADRIGQSGATLAYVRFFDDFIAQAANNIWDDIGTPNEKRYVVETGPSVIQRCLLMATDPGDLVLDPTCGSGTTAYVAEQWGRRWITIDTSRVALALSRARIMGARYPFYLLADSAEGQAKEAEIAHSRPATAKTKGDIRQGFVYERVPHVTLKSIANNAEIDLIWGRYQLLLEPLRHQINHTLKTFWEEWDIPREADTKWPSSAKQAHIEWWRNRIARQKEIDASIASRADFESLYDKPYDDKKKVRVAGPFTVESLSPHRALTVDEKDKLVDPLAAVKDDANDFAAMILENLRTAGVQQAHKQDKISFTSLTPWPGYFICAEGRYDEGTAVKRAAMMVGPEFGTGSRPDVVAAAREAGDSGFDILITCAFNYEAHASEFHKLGRIPILKARINADMHMAADLKNTGKGNLFESSESPTSKSSRPKSASSA